tara:strand:- start:2382 stop:2672 length:291 start_codon:yes stop_codon:yes gene_type:complete
MTLKTHEIDEITLAIADKIFIQVSSWHLYLGDAGLANALAIECSVNLSEGPGIAARKALESIKVDLGAGNSKLPLARLIPSGQIFDLEEILSQYSA